MRKFTNPEAIKYIEEAIAIEEYVVSEEQRLLSQGLPLLDYYQELLTEAAGLRVLADEIEDNTI